MVIVTDIHGAEWIVSEARATALGFDLLLGRPRHGSRQGATVILTDDLSQVLDALRGTPKAIADLLPIGKTTIKRLRAQMGHDWHDDRLQWYLDRIDDLGALTGAEFADRHKVSEAAASIWRTKLLGPRQRPAGWWRAADVRDALLVGTVADAAATLGIAAGSVRRIRSMLAQTEQEHER